MTISRSVAVSVSGGVNAIGVVGELGRLVNVPPEFSMYFDFKESYYIVREEYYLEDALFADFTSEYFYLRNVGFYPKTNVRV